jgi:hypothetical protein
MKLYESVNNADIQSPLTIYIAVHLPVLKKKKKIIKILYKYLQFHVVLKLYILDYAYLCYI